MACVCACRKFIVWDVFMIVRPAYSDSQSTDAQMCVPPETSLAELLIIALSRSRASSERRAAQPSPLNFGRRH